MPILRAFSTLGCPELSLDAVFSLARRHRIDGVEIRALDGSVDLAALFAGRIGTPERLRARLDGEKIRIVGFGTSVRAMTPRDDDRAALLALAPWADAAGVPSLRVFDGGEHADAAEIARAAALLDWWRETRARKEWTVDLVIETHDALADAIALSRFLNALPEVRLLWDAHHTWKKGGADPVDTWHLVAPRTRHIHVKDSISRPGPRLPYTYVPPGEGKFPMAALRAALAASRYDGVLSLEWEKFWHPDLPPLDAALDAAAANAWW
jgi:sugar phosphate isomerase/epimerase